MSKQLKKLKTFRKHVHAEYYTIVWMRDQMVTQTARKFQSKLEKMYTLNNLNYGTTANITYLSIHLLGYANKSKMTFFIL